MNPSTYYFHKNLHLDINIVIQTTKFSGMSFINYTLTLLQLATSRTTFCIHLYERSLSTYPSCGLLLCNKVHQVTKMDDGHLECTGVRTACRRH